MTPQLTVAMPSVVVAEILSAVFYSALPTLPVGGDDSLKFSFEATSGVGEVSGDGRSSESTPLVMLPQWLAKVASPFRFPAS